jgi:DNA repair protein RecN (Recombination protein N)
MLSELTIRNFAIIDDLRLQFAPGFTVLTGETGAGKSIILDAVSLVLGGRADSTVVRAGSDRAYLEAAFDLPPALQKTILPLLEKEGLDDETDNHLLLAREVRANGRTISRINGRSVNLNFMRQIADPLVDIHGQGEHLSLLKPRAHLPLLDSYGDLNSEREKFSSEVTKLRKVQQELVSLRQDERLIAQRIDMLQYQIKEIDAADLQEGEESELREERTRLANAEQLNRLAAEVTAVLTGFDDETMAATDLIGKAERALNQLARLDESRKAFLENLQGLAFQLSELAAEVRDYQNKLEFNPQRLDEVEERLELIGTLKRKYGDNIADVLATRTRATKQLEQITHSKERVAELEVQADHLLHLIGKSGQILSKKRQATAGKLSTAVERQLSDLQMAGARFEVQFERETAADGAFVKDQRFAFDQTGLDRAEFLVSANPGEPLKPVAKVASGGETARLMLALKTALAEVDGTPTLIFDEIDQGIGGRVGGVVGQKLWGLTTVGEHQVVVVTHLPQLAGYGDVHIRVSKQVKEQRTITSVKNLDANGRGAELADMLGTSGETAVGGAESILRQVKESKKSRVS